MRQFLLLIIKLYWKFIPEKKRRKCLFKESCSNYVFRHTKEHGFLKGLLALKSRIKKCRGGYELYTGENGFEMKLSDGTVLYEEEISLNIMNPIYQQIETYSNSIGINL
jgi:putative component of membrane protein insertase Oxa1/YidC/SpoIIIJ protein YidD